MKRAGRFLHLPLLATALAALLAAGCNTYHYYDVTIESVSPVTVTQTSSMAYCEVVITGSASDTFPFNTPQMGGMGGCPPSGPTIGTFEYSTFADSGNITFTFNGYPQTVDPTMLCTSGSVTKPADGTVTQSGTIMLTMFNTTTCPPHVTP